MNDLQRLKQLIPFPVHPLEIGSPEKWIAVEHTLRTILPTDYKQFVDNYGSGYIGGFLYFRNPFSSKPYMNLIYQLDEFVSTSDTEFESTLPYSFFPKPSGLLPFGATINGDSIFWVTNNSPDKWSIFILEARGTTHAHYHNTMTEFVVHFLEGDINNDVFSSEFIKDGNLFNPNI